MCVCVCVLFSFSLTIEYKYDEQSLALYADLSNGDMGGEGGVGGTQLTIACPILTDLSQHLLVLLLKYYWRFRKAGLLE